MTPRPHRGWGLVTRADLPGGPRLHNIPVRYLLSGQFPPMDPSVLETGDHSLVPQESGKTPDRGRYRLDTGASRYQTAADTSKIPVGIGKVGYLLDTSVDTGKIPSNRTKES